MIEIKEFAMILVYGASVGIVVGLFSLGISACFRMFKVISDLGSGYRD